MKHRPHQSNQNRIVLAFKEGSTLRIALKCYPHNLRNDSPIGTRLQRQRRSERPCFSDANCRREVTPDPYGQTSQFHRGRHSQKRAIPHAVDGNSEDYSEFLTSRRRTIRIPKETRLSRGCFRSLSVCSSKTQH